MPSRRLVARLFVSVLFTIGCQAASGSVQAATPATPTPTEPTVTIAPDDTFNEFLPEDRAIGDCISAAPRPGCGSKAQGGWHQYFVLIALLGGLSFIGWRIIAGVRRTQRP